MCIIVAKNAGVKMPSKEILSNCFTNNPDGAGIMLAAKGRVYGFKGLMTLDSVTAKLKQLEKRFGSLNKLPVVLHFRIGTHGANIAANTHPFPVAGSYKTLRKLEWSSNLGMAHNGIISSVGRHPDVKKENVSDTMVFIRRVVAPIAKTTDIMADKDILDALQLTADSKLCFLDYKGNLQVLGKFEMKDGVYYSNSTYEKARIKYYSGYYTYDYDDEDDRKWSSWTLKKSTPKKTEKVVLSKDDEDYLRKQLAVEYGLTELDESWDILIETNEVQFTLSSEIVPYAIDYSDWSLYYWDCENYEWYESSYSDCIVDLVQKEAEVDA